MRVSARGKRPYKPLAAEEIRPLRLDKDIAAGHPSAQEGKPCNGGSTKRATALFSLGRSSPDHQPDSNRRLSFFKLLIRHAEPGRQR